ncbi:hypothetical protein PENTCL1PPCAC_15302, partial [Pristionchus entomophagus]
MSSLGFGSRPAEKLRVLIADNQIEANGSCPNYPKFGPSVSCPYPGWCLEVIIDVLVRSGNIPHEFVVERNESAYIDWGRLQDNGRFSGILGRVESGEVDMACLFFQKSILRMDHFDFSVAVSEIRPTFIVREIPVTLWSLILNCLRPYDTAVWIGMLVTMLVWTIIGRMEISSGLREPRSNGRYFAWDVFDELFNCGDHYFYFLSGKLTRLVFSVFQVGLLRGMYTALLLTALVTPTDIAPIKSQTDAVRLIQSGRYKLISDKSKWFAQEIALSSEKMFMELREATRNNPIIDPISDEQALNLVSEGGYIYQTQIDSSAMVAVAGKCYTFVFTEGLPFRSAHFLMRKGSPWLDVLNTEIMKNYPMIDQVYKRYFEQRQLHTIRPDCPPDQFQTPGASDPLNFWSVFGIFMLGSCGLAIAVISLVVELVLTLIFSH